MRNILVKKRDIIQLTEFGLHRLLGKNFVRSRREPPMVPPDEPETPAADSWALGAVLYRLCLRKPPPMPDPFVHPTFVKLKSYSAPLKGLLQNLLGRNPAKRHSPRRIVKLPFIAQQLGTLFCSLSRVPMIGMTQPVELPPSETPINNVSALFPHGWQEGTDEEADETQADVQVVPEVAEVGDAGYDEELCEHMASEFLSAIMCIMVEPQFNA
jgi:serine/threonine protein kinase